MLRAIKKRVSLGSQSQLDCDLIRDVSLAGYMGSRRLFGTDTLLLVHNVQQAHYAGQVYHFLFFSLMITFNPNSISDTSKKCFKLFYFWKIFFPLLLPSSLKGCFDCTCTLCSQCSQEHLFQNCIHCCILRTCSPASCIFIWVQLTSVLINHILQKVR